MGSPSMEGRRITATGTQTGGWAGASRQDLLSAPLGEPTWPGQGRRAPQHALPGTGLLQVQPALRRTSETRDPSDVHN